MALRSYEDAPFPFSSHSYVFGATSQKALIQLEERYELPFIWLRKEGNLQTTAKQETLVPEEREMFSIQAVLEFLHNFANIGKIDCVTDAELQTIEKNFQWNFHFR